jgi:hypothetical protein
VFALLHMFGVLFLYHFPNVLNARLLCIDNEQSMVPECVAGDFPEQQPGEGKCPLPIMSYLLYNSLSCIT